MKAQAKDEPFDKLTSADKRKLHKHFDKKLKFYAQQDETKWQRWPAKMIPTPKKMKDKKTRNFKKKIKATN